METEITEIARWVRIYNNPNSYRQFNIAFAYLKKVHDKYGTIDINIIKQLTR